MLLYSSPYSQWATAPDGNLTLTIDDTNVNFTSSFKIFWVFEEAIFELAFVSRQVVFPFVGAISTELVVGE